MRISQLHLLLALEKYGSFSKAAKEMFLSQPYISATIKDLEDELQKLTDKYIKEVENAVEAKSKEVMTV